MGHFAEIIDGTVHRVIAIHNDILDDNGIEREQKGIDYLDDILPTEGAWKQTSYNGSFRLRLAEENGTYDSDNNVFIPEKPYPSYVLNTDTYDWESPVGDPPVKGYEWDEDTLSWVKPASPHPSWEWFETDDGEYGFWRAPISPPEELTEEEPWAGEWYTWDEENQRWLE